MTDHPKRGWIAKLADDNPDRVRWNNALPPISDPCLETFPVADATVWALRSQRFDAVVDVAELKGLADPLIEQLNGAQNLIDGLAHLQLNGAGYADGYGGFSAYVFLRGVGLFAMASAVTVNNPNLVQSPPEPSELQRWLAVAGREPVAADMLRWASRIENWFDVYKAIEAAELFGPGEHALREALGRQGIQLKKVRETANSFRHTPGSKNYYKPKCPATLTEARIAVAAAVRFVLSCRN